MKLFTILLLLLATAVPSFSQDSGERLRTLVGLNAPGGRAYALWQAPDSTLLSGKRYAVFSKSGVPGGAGLYSLLTITKTTLRAVDIAPILADNPQLFVESELIEAIDALFNISLPPAMPLNEKLSALMMVANRDAEAFEQMILLSRVHPVIALCLGTATALPLNGAGTTTFELRVLPGNDLSRAGDSIDVAGRVTVDPAAPVTLPAPQSPVEVLLDGPKSHLAIRMRWDIGDDLRAMSVFQHGYNVYRIERDFAEANNYHVTPPTLMVLTDPGTPQISLINGLPILPPEGGDYFIHDDNRRFEDGGTPFEEGAQYYYFVTARDVLGRDGMPSAGTLMTAIGRRRPAPPAGVEVVNHFNRNPAGVSEKRLKVSWFSPLRGQTPDSYLVFRWDSIGAMQTAMADAANNPPVPIKVVDHVPDTFAYSVIDGFDPVAGRTYWYSVMATWENAIGEQLLSPNSSMVWGVLRDRVGPGPVLNPKRVVTTRNLTASHTGTAVLLAVDPEAPQPIELTLTPNDEAITWARFIHIDEAIAGTNLPDNFPVPQGPASPLPQNWKLIGDVDVSVAEIKVTYRPADVVQQGLLVCIAGTDSELRAVAVANYGDFGTAVDGNGWAVDFAADYAVTTAIISADEPLLRPHLAVDLGVIREINLQHIAPDTAQTYKLYRRVDNAEMTLVKAGIYSDPELVGIEWTYRELELPANASRLCHYIQTFDEHGNPSAMQLISCVQTSARVKIAKPLLTPLVAGGNSAAATASLVWACDPNGVDGFRVLVAESTAGEATITSSLWTQDPLQGFGDIDGFRYHSFLTPRTAVFGADGRFEVPLEVISGKGYVFRVVAISAAGDASVPSEPMSFTWQQSDVALGPQVAWPVRRAGEVVVDIDSQLLLEPRWIDNVESGFTGVAVRIGQVILPSPTSFFAGTLDENGRTPTRLVGVVKPAYTYLSGLSGGLEIALDPDALSANKETPRSFVLYRAQVANNRYPQISGQLVQVTPLIDRIRSRGVDGGNNDIQPGVAGAQVSLRIYDPFIDAIRENDQSSVVQFIVKDTQGVVSGACYRYELVRFSPNGEIASIHAIGEVQIP
ncbi:MAG: hypothetical protein ACI9NC_002310 [Verrucomicrobiales bacterium]|jgi:hypothetical protein